MIDRIFAEYKSTYDSLVIEGKNTEDIKPISDAVGSVLTSSRIAKRDGLIGLEELAEGLDETSLLSKYYKELIMLVVYGSDPKLVEEIGLYKLISFGFKDVSKIAGLIYLLGILSIQQGEHPRVIEEKINALIPLQWK